MSSVMIAKSQHRVTVELIHAEIHPLQNMIVRNAVAADEPARHTRRSARGGSAVAIPVMRAGGNAGMLGP
jgi:hypothetical protein